MPIHRLVVRTGAAAGVVATLLGSSAALAAPDSAAVPGAAAVAQTGILPPHNPGRQPAAEA